MTRAIVAALLAAVACGTSPAGANADWPFQPTPIGAGPAYQPPARWPFAGGAAFHGLRGDIHGGLRFHLELFGDGRVIVVPGGIGVSGGRVTRYGLVTEALGRARAWTLQPGGVVQLAAPGLRLGDVFAVWGQPLGPDRLLTFDGRVRVYVGGRPWRGDPALLALHDGDQVVLEVGEHVPPHPSFTFPLRVG